MNKTKTTITQHIIDEVQQLAEQGLNNAMISQALDLGVETLSRNKQLKQAIQMGKMILAKRVTASILETLEDTPANQQLLVKRLGLFNPIIRIKKPTNAKEALENLAEVTKQFANGQINESQLRTIEAVSNSFVKGFEITEIEQRISKLEKAVNAR